MLHAITPLIITHDEIDNIGRTLAKLSWAERIVVVDSGSTDGTLDLLRSIPKVDIFTRPFDTFANQCNFGLLQIETEWVLSLDADYVLSDRLISEIGNLPPNEDVSGYWIEFVYCIYGRALRSSVYPAHVALFRNGRGTYRDEGHGHRVFVEGALRRLNGVIFHDDRKPLSRWEASQRKYAVREVDYLLAEGAHLKLSDKMRSSRMMVWCVLPYVLFIKGGWRAGQAGWYYALQRLFAEVGIALELQDRIFRRRR